jgi:hypothetical protein
VRSTLQEPVEFLQRAEHEARTAMTHISIIRFFLLLLIVVSSLLLSACETTPDYKDAGSSIPWNQPAEWEKEPNLGAQFVW